MQPIHVITTGGTIDKVYDSHSGGLVVGDPVFPEIAEKAGVDANYVMVSRLFKQDSLDITEVDRCKLAEVIRASSSDRILVIHGTDTLGQSAALIAGTVKTKTVVMVGAMTPHSVANSDAEFNLGFAFASVQLLPSGVYVAMHGRVLPFNKYVKNVTLGRFIESV